MAVHPGDASASSLSLIRSLFISPASLPAFQCPIKHRYAFDFPPPWSNSLPSLEPPNVSFHSKKKRAFVSVLECTVWLSCRKMLYCCRFFHLFFKGLPSSSKGRWIKYDDIQVLTSTKEHQAWGIRWEELAFFTQPGIVEKKMSPLDRLHLILIFPRAPGRAAQSASDCIPQTWRFNVLMSVCRSSI